MLKKIMLSIMLILALMTTSFAETSNGSHLVELSIINKSSIEPVALNKDVTRNELYIWVSRLTRELSATPIPSSFTDIIPNSSFSQIAAKAKALGLLLPDQNQGKFEPAKTVTHEELCYVMLKLLKENCTMDQVLYQANEAGLLEGLRIRAYNKPVNKDTTFKIIENALKLKREGTQTSLESYLVLNNPIANNTEQKVNTEVNTNSTSNVDNTNVSTNQNAALLKHLSTYNASQVVAEYLASPTETQLKSYRIKSSDGKILKAVSWQLVDTTTVIYKLDQNMMDGVVYQDVEHPLIATTYLAMDAVKPYVVTQLSSTLHSEVIKLVFNKKMDIASAIDSRNYQIQGGLEIKNIRFALDNDNHHDFTTVLIETAQQVPGKTYNITIDGNLKDSYDRTLSEGRALTRFSLYGASYDIYAPKVSRVTVDAIDKVAVLFEEASGFDEESVLNPMNYKIYDVDNKKAFEVKSATFKVNKDTGRKTIVVLETAPLDRMKRYMVEVVNVKDVHGNMISHDTDYRASFALTDKEEQVPRIVTAEGISKNLIKVTFDKGIQIPDDFKLENIQLRDNLKALKVEKDANNENVLWIKTSDHTVPSLSLIRIENIYDNFGNRTRLGETRQYYSASITETVAPTINLIEGNMAMGNNIVKLRFSKEMDYNSLVDVRNYSVKDLDVFYAYTTQNREVYIVTSPQRKNQVYELKIKPFNDDLGTPLQSSSCTQMIIGFTLD